LVELINHLSTIALLTLMILVYLEAVKPRYERRYKYDTAPIRWYEKISKIKMRYGWDML